MGSPPTAYLAHSVAGGTHPAVAGHRYLQGKRWSPLTSMVWEAQRHDVTSGSRPLKNKASFWVFLESIRSIFFFFFFYLMLSIVEERCGD